MPISIAVCFGSFTILVIWLRRAQVSVGIPVAYLFALLFIHVPGAYAHIVGGDYLQDTPATEIGIRFTAIGSVAFVVGVIGIGMLSEFRQRGQVDRPRTIGRRQFAVFCLFAGLFVTYTLRLIVNIPSIGAVIEKGGGIWVLGVLLGLQTAVRKGSPRKIAIWCVAMGIFPVLTLLLGGFLSFGSTPVFIILSSLVISTRSKWRVGIGIPVIALTFLFLFLSYFLNRDEIRAAVWGREDFLTRIETSTAIFTEVEPFDSNNPLHLQALDLRLNQNFFVGRAAQRIQSGEVELLYGSSFWEGAISLVPRIIWPSKPVYGGSPKIIMEMTGFKVNDWTSFGVGSVMEFHINFGMPSLVIGFLLLGIMFGWLDIGAALHIRHGKWGHAPLYFLPASVMIHPNGSLVEMVSGGASAFLAALGWKYLWEHYSGSNAAVRPFTNRRIHGPNDVNDSDSNGAESTAEARTK